MAQLQAAPEGPEHDRLLEELVAEAFTLSRGRQPADAAAAAADRQKGWHIKLHRVDGLIESMDVRPAYFDKSGRWAPGPDDEIVRVPLPRVPIPGLKH